MNLLEAFLDPWCWRMAWRDSRRSRGRLLLFASSLVLGVAALVAIGSLGRNLARSVDAQARTLLGADLVLETRREWTPEQNKFMGGLGAVEEARESALTSMAYFPKNQGTRLSQVRAIRGRFPFYGNLETDPPEAAAAFAAGRGAIVEEALLLQFGAEPGDVIQIGSRPIPILGTLRKVPGEAATFSALAPRVLIPMDELAPELLARGSLVRHKAYLRFADPSVAPALLAKSKEELSALKLDATDLARSKRQLRRAFDQVTDFLNLVGFVSLLLGGIGVASGIAAYLKGKVRTAAVLHCLGASSRQTLVIYLLQTLALGLVGAVGGAILGVLLQSLVPRFVGTSFALQIEFRPEPLAILQGLAVGLAVCVLFTLLPLLPMRRVPPLLTLRASEAEATDRRRDPALWIARIALALALIAFPWWQSGNARFSVGFAAALAAGTGLLWGVAKLLAWGARRFPAPGLSYAWRQGLANLHRPGNRTVLMMFMLGLSTMLLLGLHLTEGLLRRQFASEDNGNQPNLIFFDIRPDQLAAARKLVTDTGLPDLGAVPVVTMRLATVAGKKVEDLFADKSRRTPDWVLNREYRSTYRERISDTEQLVAGRWRGQVKAGETPIPISLEADIARDLGVGIGSEIVFDVQGVPVVTRVESLRRVEWRRFSPNFFVVFPTGAIEDAPTFEILVSRATTSAQSAKIQAAIVKQFPNVSAVDLSLIAGTIRDIIAKATTAVRVLSLFTIGTGLLVLISAVFTGRFDRVGEAALLRTLGATRETVFRILAVEYLALGSLAALTGIVLAAGGSWLLATFVFELQQTAVLAIVAPPALIALVSVVLLTLGVGLFTSRGVTNHPPLEVLRAEG